MYQSTLDDILTGRLDDSKSDSEGREIIDYTKPTYPRHSIDPLPIEESDYTHSSLGYDSKPVDVPTSPPQDMYPGEPDPGEINIPQSLLDWLEVRCKPKKELIADLPRWIDEEDIPSNTDHRIASKGPEYCDQCGTRNPYDRPLEQGRVLVLEGDDGNPNYDPCPRGKYNIRRCDCCGCPYCGSKAIRFRQTKTPDYACGNPNCKERFSHPVERPFDPDMTDARERLFWACRYCDQPTLAPFKGIPDSKLR